MIDATYSPGLSSPVFDGQAIFRLVLNAISRPAFKFTIDDNHLPKNAPLPPLAAGVALTLLDFDTPAWLSPAWSKAAGWLAFHNGVKTTSSPGEASFILADSFEEVPPLPGLAAGSERYPDRSATVMVMSPKGPNYADIYAKGPGLATPKALPPNCLTAEFLRAWNENHSLYPCGVDLIILNDDGLWALPRSIKLASGLERQAA